MDWNSEVKDYTFEVEPGDYRYVIKDAEKTVSKGGKLPSSPMLRVKLEIPLKSGGLFHVTDYIVLHESLEWKVGQFLESIGQKKPGESCKPDWSLATIIGSKGFAKIKNEEQSDGRVFPKVAKWLPKKDKEEEKANFFGDEFKPVDDSNIPF